MTDMIRWCFTHHGIPDALNSDDTWECYRRDDACDVQDGLVIQANVTLECETVEVPSYEWFDGARAQVGVMYVLKDELAYPGKYLVSPVEEGTET